MSKFLSPLRMELVTDQDGCAMRTRAGRQLYRLLATFSYQSDVVEKYRKAAGIMEPCAAIPGLIEAPEGFVTDLCSKPQIALAFMGDNEQQASVPHDYVYNTHCIPRDIADKMLYEACILTGTPKLQAMGIYLAVRIGGGGPDHWGADPADTKPTATPLTSDA